MFLISFKKNQNQYFGYVGNKRTNYENQKNILFQFGARRVFLIEKNSFPSTTKFADAS